MREGGGDTYAHPGSSYLGIGYDLAEGKWSVVNVIYVLTTPDGCTHPTVGGFVLSFIYVCTTCCK